MIIRTIALRNYRGVEQRELHFEAGVNIVEGPNEAGKTSLAEALRLIFEYPDSSTHRNVASIHPVHRDEGPEIDIELETGPYEFHYHKRYRRRPETVLEVRRPRPESHTGREAHARAEEILQETIDVALWRALQLQQGVAIEQADLRDREALSRALDAASGGAGSEDGDERGALFDRVRDEYLRYYTEKGRLRGDRVDMHAELDEISHRVAELEASERALAEDVSEAERLTAGLADLRRRLPALESEASRLASEWSAVVQQREELERATRDSEAARLRAQAALEAQKQRKLLARDSEASVARRAELEKRILTESATLRREEVRWQELNERLAEARAALDACETRVREAEAVREIKRATVELRRVRARIQRVDELEGELQAALESSQAIRVDDAGLRALEEAELRVRQARARLEEGGVRVELRALANTEIWLAKGPASGTGESPKPPGLATHLASGETRSLPVEQQLSLRLPGALEITVVESSGATRGQTLGAASAQAIEQRDRLLADLGVPSVADAARAFEERERARQIVQSTRANLEQVLAGASTSDLRAEAAGLSETLTRLGNSEPRAEPSVADTAAPSQSASTASSASSASSASTESTDSIDATLHPNGPEPFQLACEDRDRVRATVDRAVAQAEAARERREELRLEEMRLQGGIETAVAQGEALGDRLDALRRETPDPLLAGRVAETSRESSAAESRAARLREAISSIRTDPLDALNTNAQQVLRSARAEEQTRSLSLVSVNARLEAQQETGLFEELQRARSRASSLQREHDARERRARAARRLYLEMCQQRERAREQYLQPLRERIERLGRIVFGASFAVSLDSSLRIESRTLEGRTVDFESLSTGAQEQIGLLTRLAVAMTVASEGGVPLILDDALGNSDPLRLQSMGAMLAQAGRECQIIVLTCSPERFRQVGGAHVQRISAAAQGAPETQTDTPL